MVLDPLAEIEDRIECTLSPIYAKTKKNHVRTLEERSHREFIVVSAARLQSRDNAEGKQSKGQSKRCWVLHFLLADPF